MAESKGGFGFGVIVGAIAGGLAAFFLTPNTGAQNQKIAKEKLDEFINYLKSKEVEDRLRLVAGKLNEQTHKAYEYIRPIILKNIDELGGSLDNITKGKFNKMVHGVIDAAKKNLPELKKEFEKLRDGFVQFFARDNCCDGGKCATAVKKSKEVSDDKKSKEVSDDKKSKEVSEEA